MSIRKKLLVFCITLLTVAVAAYCVLVIVLANRQAMTREISSAQTDIYNFCSYFEQASPKDSPETPTALRSSAIYFFRAGAGSDEYTLRCGDDFLCNNIGFDIEALLNNSETENLRYRFAEIGGKSYLLSAENVYFCQQAYSIALARDITDTVADVRKLGFRCIAVGIGVILLSAFIMFFIIKKSLQPIGILRESAGLIAAGNYAERADVCGKDEIAELAADFNRMADAVEQNISELNEKNERQRMFINDLSHELKTPVTSILLNSETLLMRRLAPAAQENVLSHIYDQGKWLERLSGKLMTLVMLQGEITLSEESVSELLESVRETTRASLEEHNIKLIIECSANNLLMDTDLMRSCLVNLVENARRASEDGGEIAIHAHGKEIAVCDHGRGIPQEELARITEPFYMVDRSRSKKNGGSGLGLALVKQILAAHGALLEIESILGEGTVMRIRFGE